MHIEAARILPTMHIFTPSIGQYENIGDIILRRPLIEWLRPAGKLHVYVGQAPEGFEAALGLGASDAVYRSFPAWYLAGLGAAWRGEACYAFKPGEIQLTLKGMKEHLAMLPLLALVRFRGGRIVRVGSGARNFAALPRALMRPSVSLANLVRWRDQRTAEYLGQGGVMPDLGFSDGDTHMATGARPWLVVSMRGDRQGVSEDWLDTVRWLSAHLGLKIRVVTQVARDAALSRELAHRLSASLDDWDGTAHDRQEERLRSVYRETRVVVSDRLHVLISAFTHGAHPIALLTDASDKIRRHFAAAGVTGMDLQIDGPPDAAVQEALRLMMAREDELRQSLSQARDSLRAVREEVLRCLAGEAP